MNTERIFLCSKDIQLLTGKSERSSRRLIARIKLKYSKKDNKYITVEDFCNYMGNDRNSVTRIIG